MRELPDKSEINEFSRRNTKLIEKKILRKEIKERLQTLPKEIYEHRSYTIAQKIFKDPLWQSAQSIGITISSPPEVDTFQIIRKAWDEGKTNCDSKVFT